MKLVSTLQFATFRLGELLLGIEVTGVQEVIRYQPMTPVPLAHPAVEGLINLRGQIVLAIDARRSLGLPPAGGESQPMNIVLQTGEGLVSLLVDEIGDVIDVPTEAHGAVPDNMPAGQRELIRGIYDLPAGLMLVLDTDRVLANAC